MSDAFNSSGVLTGMADMANTVSPTSKIKDVLNSMLKASLFMEAMRNLNWSRNYCWYVELDGVPNPFQRGGVLGLPVSSVVFDMAPSANTFMINNSMTPMPVPKDTSAFTSINITVFDDEQGTIRQFFERWWNQIYNPYRGVLPVVEACKQITIYLQKTTRRNIKRVYYNIDQPGVTKWDKGSPINTAFNYLGVNGDTVARTTEGMDFLVFPVSDFKMQNLNYDSAGLISYNVELAVADFINRDFGDPLNNNGISTVFNTQLGGITNGSSFLDKLADYI